MRRILALLLFVPLLVLARAELANRLQGHPSPYLALHGNDPVHWQTWGREAIERARAEHKPLYISSGYFACHWCHVMQQESYSEPVIAALLNRYFIPVKVDRELQPGLDAYLIDFVERTRGRAGWPLNVFLTPEGYPFFGLTYAPKAQFQQLLERVSKVWSEKQARLREMARTATEELARVATGVATGTPESAATLEARLKDQALRIGDEMEGGFGHQNRFPMAPQLAVLLELQSREPDRRLEELLRLTLEQMAGQGLRDQLGGGFFRYTTDPGWQVPHFEKMLYTQALLVPLYLRAAQVLQRPEYRRVAADTLEFVLRELKGRDGGFIASLSAVDDHGVEGGYYLWSREQLRGLLQPQELRVAELVWHLQGAPAHAGGFLPVQRMTAAQAAERLDMDPAAAETLLARARTKLLLARETRRVPRDDKQLAGWNGLLLSALVDAARTLQDERYRQAARGLRDFLVERLWDGRQLYRAAGPKGWLGTASLQDYAFVGQGLADWAAYTGSAADRGLAKRLVRDAWRRFFEANGWRLGGSSLIPGIPPEPALPDGPLPSPSAATMQLSRALAVSPEAEGALDPMATARVLSYPVVARLPFTYAGHSWVLIEAPGTTDDAREKRPPPLTEAGQR